MNKVVFMSRGGNTEKLSEAIAKGVGVPAKTIKDYDQSVSADLLFVGASIYAGKIDKSMREFLCGLTDPAVKKVAVFGTSAGKKTTRNEICQILEPKGITVLSEEFHCKGSFLFAHRGHPDAADLQAAEDFAKRISEANGR